MTHAPDKRRGGTKEKEKHTQKTMSGEREREKESENEQKKIVGKYGHGIEKKIGVEESKGRIK